MDELERRVAELKVKEAKWKAIAKADYKAGLETMSHWTLFDVRRELKNVKELRCEARRRPQ